QQFRMVTKALKHERGIKLLTLPKVTTLSARQAQIKAVDLETIGTDDSHPTPSFPSENLIGTVTKPRTGSLEPGPIIDVVPYVSADGLTIQLTVIPTYKEFA